MSSVTGDGEGDGSEAVADGASVLSSVGVGSSSAGRVSLTWLQAPSNSARSKERSGMARFMSNWVQTSEEATIYRIVASCLKRNPYCVFGISDTAPKAGRGAPLVSTML